jgi:hypothetical protein
MMDPNLLEFPTYWNNTSPKLMPKLMPQHAPAPFPQQHAPITSRQGAGPSDLDARVPRLAVIRTGLRKEVLSAAELHLPRLDKSSRILGVLR